MCDAPGVRLTDLLAAREDEAIMEAVSGAGARRHTRTSINKARLARKCEIVSSSHFGAQRMLIFVVLSVLLSIALNLHLFGSSGL